MPEPEPGEVKNKLLAQKEHTDKRRLEDNYHQRTSGLYLSDMIFGANDGIVTTFAVVAGASGAALSPVVVYNGPHNLDSQRAEIKIEYTL